MKFKKTLLTSITLLSAFLMTLSQTSCSNRDNNNNNNNNNEVEPSIKIDSPKYNYLSVNTSILINYETINYEGDINIINSNDNVCYIKNIYETNIEIVALHEGISEISFILNNNIKETIHIVVSRDYKPNYDFHIYLDKYDYKINENLEINIDAPFEIDKSKLEINYYNGNNSLIYEDDEFKILESGFNQLNFTYENYKSNSIYFYAYDFELKIDKKIGLNQTKYIEFVNYQFDDYKDIRINVLNNQLLRTEYDKNKNKFLLKPLKTGITKLNIQDRDKISNFYEIEIVEYLEDDNNNNNNDDDENNDIDYSNISKNEFYKNYKRAKNYEDAKERTKYHFMSGDIKVNDQKPTISNNLIKENDLYVHNSSLSYKDNDKTYVIKDAYGNDKLEIYEGAAYTSLEEVAAYVYAFNDVPSNYTSSKNESPKNSEREEYLRLNHSEFSGNVDKYPYEPILPDISGCGGNLIYYEIDIGTTGTDCDPNYEAKIYNDGKKITRGAARIVYSRYYEDSGKEVEPEDKYVFYTYNHYNDFQEYLNYYNGWGEMFGNITGGGILSSKDPNKVNPTPYVETIRKNIF